VIQTLWTWVNVQGAYDDPGNGTSGADSVDTDSVGTGSAGDDTSDVANADGGGTSTLRDFRIDITLRADPLTAIMLVMVTFVSLLVVIYSIGYMHGDPGYWRFFTYVSLFIFSMTMLVSASNFVLLYVFWEAVGVCSYLLIGFWYQKPEAAAAGKKAFLVNRIGDFGFALGLFLIWTTYGTLNFHDTPELGVDGVLGQAMLLHPERYVGGGTGLAICLLLLIGACGKSAQFPLHVWLPDAMEGPTPVSALIHAATMVTAGVYMVVRCTPLFFAAPEAQVVIAVIGCFTALLAGAIAMTQTDLKRVLAYSTISQLGFMFLGLGAGSLAGITAGMFHLFTHAIFKALLFLGAGSVMHSMGGVIDMRRFSGLRHVMPITHKTFAMGALALAGLIPFAGFWSKDAIVAAVHQRSHDGDAIYEWLYYIALFTAALTAFYTARAFFLTFYGPLRVPREAGSHAHESPPTMWIPLAILAFLAVTVGAYLEWTHGFLDLLIKTPVLAYDVARQHSAGLGEFHPNVALASTAIAVLGIGLAAYLYLGDQSEINVLRRMMGPLYRLSYGKFFIDGIYNALIVAPLRILATMCYWFDRRVIDALVDTVGRWPWWLGGSLRGLQNGMVQFYALAMVLGLLVLLGGLGLALGS
jgi:NADH-quinone oxidoreductase subunit L